MRDTTRAEGAPYLTPAEVGELAHLTPGAVCKAAGRGEIPVTRTATGRRIFLRADVERWLEWRRQRDTAGGGRP